MQNSPRALFLFFLLFQPILISAQEQAKSTAISPEAKKYFVSFYARDLSVLIGRKLTSTKALRVNIDFDGALSDRNSEYGDGSSVQKAEDNIKSQNLGFGLQLLQAFSRQTNLDFYVGIGPFFSYGKSKSTNTENSSGSRVGTDRESISESRTVGVTSVIGAEAAITGDVKLFVEYQVLGSIRWSKSHANTKFTASDSGQSVEEKFRADSDSRNFSFAGIRFGFAMYF